MERDNKERPGQTGIEANKELRNKRFTVRFSEDELQALKERAASNGASSTALYARSVLLPDMNQQHQEAKTEHLLRLQLLASLGKIGSNVNQIARALNRMKVWNDTTKGMFQELTKISAALASVTDPLRKKK